MKKNSFFLSFFIAGTLFSASNIHAMNVKQFVMNPLVTKTSSLQPTNSLTIQTEKINQFLYLTKTTNAKLTPSETAVTQATFSPQRVQAIEKWENWYRINTWRGPLWIKPILDKVETKSLSLYLVNQTQTKLYPFDNEPVQMTLLPQKVTVFEQTKNWYHIRTWRGDMWIKPILNKIEPINQFLSLTKNTPAKFLPFEDEKTQSEFAPQRVQAYEKVGNWYHIYTWKGPMWIQYEETSDQIPPQEVSDLSETITDTSIKLTWKNPTNTDFSKVKIYRNGTLIKETTSNQFEDTNLSSLTSYLYKVTTLDQNGNESIGLTKTFSTPDTTPPQNVLALTETHTDTSVTLKWENPSNTDFLKVKIYRNDTLIKETTSNQFEDNSLTPLMTYTYKVISVDNSQNESTGVSKRITLPDLTPPSAISNLNLTEYETYINFTWTNPTDADLDYVEIIENGQKIGTSTNGNFKRLNPNPSTDYAYRVIAVDQAGNHSTITTSSLTTKEATTYLLELDRWNIYNDGTHPIETTKGFNDALIWANQHGKTTFKVPDGHYIVKKADPTMWRDPSACINLVANITFSLDNKAVIQKETNAKEAYDTVCIGYGADNVTLKGGTYKGDKLTHDYSKKEDQSTPGTHENGIGISVFGAKNLTVDGVKAVEFTGDGMGIGGKGTLIQDLYAAHFESGAIDENGQLVSDNSKIRMKNSINLSSNPRYKEMLEKEPYFELSNVAGLPGVYDVYFYKTDGSFLTKYSVKKWRDIVQIPNGAASFKAVFVKSSPTNSYAEFWNKALATNVVVKNSEFAFNRRQGITIGGADNVLITNNSLHDMKGTLPQSGIDAEGGYGENGMLNKNLFITNNEFYKNATYDVILYDGKDATVEGNHFGSTGAIGLAVSDPFTGATIKNNHFDKTSMYISHDVNFIGNTMNDSYTSLTGPRVTFDGMTFTNSTFSMTPTATEGVTATNITTNNSTIQIWNNPTHLSNITMNGPTAGIGGSAVGNTIDNLKIYGYSLGGMSLSANTYNNCILESAVGTIPAGASGLNLNQTGSYTFNDCAIKTSGVGFIVNNKNTNVSILNSIIQSSSTKSIFSTTNINSLRLENNNIQSTGITYGTDGIIVIGDYWKRNDPYAGNIPSVTIKGNAITNTSTTSVNGIITNYVGTNAPVYTIDNNTLTKALFKLKANDTNVNNIQN